MKSSEPRRYDALATYACSKCLRRFAAVDVGGESASHLCVCGAELAAAPLSRGLYELCAIEREVASAPAPQHHAALEQPDKGYGASHGYGAAHGGPTGPGDAPAKPPMATRAARLC